MPNALFKDWLTKHYSAVIMEAMTEVKRTGVAVNFVADSQPDATMIALGPDEAAALLGVSRDYFDEHVIAELRIVRRGRRILVSLAELERWLARASKRASVLRSA